MLVVPQPGLAFAVESAPREALRQNIIALAKTAAVFELPIVVTTSASKRFSGPIFPELQSALGTISPRTHVHERLGVDRSGHRGGAGRPKSYHLGRTAD